MKLSKGIQFFAGSTQTTYDLTNLNLSAGNYAITVVAEAEGFTDSDVSNSVNYTVQAQLAAPTSAMNADGKTLEITDVANATSYDVYVDGTLKTNVASTPNTTTVDLSTLSDISDGAHTVKVKAKADGYIDSEFSNEVSYTKAPAGFKLTITGSWSKSGSSSEEGRGALSLVGVEGSSLKNPQYESSGGNESYVYYRESWGGGTVRTACPLVFENVSKVGIFGPLTINWTTDSYPFMEYVLTQDTTFVLGNIYDPS